MINPALTIRMASPHDSRALEWLDRYAERRSWPSAGPALLAERDGAPVAAIVLTSGTVLADPLTATHENLRALRFARYRLMRQGGQIDAPRSLLRRATASTLVPVSRP